MNKHAVLYDRAALVNDIDSKFTVLNKWIKAQPSTENAKTLRTVATIGAAYTAFDTIDGNTATLINCPKVQEDAVASIHRTVLDGKCPLVPEGL